MKLVIITSHGLNERDLDLEAAEPEIRRLMKNRDKYWLYLDGRSTNLEELSVEVLGRVEKVVITHSILGG